jgi:mono/diheme cytochrome c family protein
MKMSVKAIASLAITVVALTACTAVPDSPGLEYTPDMYRSAAIEPYVDYGQIKERINPELAGKLSAMVPPFGAIPYYGTDSAEVSLRLPYHRLPNVAFKQTHDLRGFDFSTDDTYLLAAADLVNPFTLTEQNAEKIFADGKKLFNANCSQCHGEKGDGKGPMSTNGIFSGVPDYADKKELSNGQIFYSIYYGKGAMGSHASILNKKEIWTLVHYIRKFQDPNYGKFGEAVVAAADSTKAEVK